MDKFEDASGATCEFCTQNDHNIRRDWWELNVCCLDIREVNNEDFTISSEINHTILGLSIENKADVKHLPTNLRTTFPDLVMIYVTHCSVTSINEKHFKGLSNLSLLHLHHNKIESVSNDAFVDLVALIELYLSHNRIQVLGESTFDSLRELDALYLNNNEIQFLHPKTFGKSNLTILMVNDNRILSLDENIFEGLTNLKILDLEANKLERIPKNLFKNNLKLSVISLNANNITFIDAIMFDHLLDMRLVDLYSNNCIDARYTKKYDDYDNLYNAKRNFDVMKEHLRQNCSENSIQGVTENVTSSEVPISRSKASGESSEV